MSEFRGSCSIQETRAIPPFTRQLTRWAISMGLSVLVAIRTVQSNTLTLI